MLTTLFQYTSRTAVTTIEWTELMRRIRNGYWRDIVDRCRREAIGGDELRRRLPAFGVSVTFLDGDEAANVVKYNHIVGIDFNKVLADGGDPQTKIAECRDICREVPSVVGFYVSKSRRGFRIFVKVNTGIAEHKRIYHPLQEYFEELLGLQANDRYKDITQLSFVSYDPDCFYRDVDTAQAFSMENVCPGLASQEVSARMMVTARNVREYVLSRYDIRYNVRERMMQCRRRADENDPAGGQYEWNNIGERFFNMFVSDMNANGIRVTYNQFQWMMDNYNEMVSYDAAKDYDGKLPEWDGTDYIDMAARLMETDGDALADWLKGWLKAMYRGWMYGEFNNRALLLQSETAATGKTDWALGLLPQELTRYMLATSACFMRNCPDNRRAWLLIVLMDFDGNDWDTVERIMEETPGASVIITAQRKIEDVPQYVKQFNVERKRDENTLVSIPTHKGLYSQLKHIAG